MNQSNRWMAAALIIVALDLSACAQKPAEPVNENEPAKVEPVKGGEGSSVTLTKEAVKRLDIQIAEVRTDQVHGKPRKVVPYAAVLYDPDGRTWVFTNPEPCLYVRQPITIDYIEADQAILSDGPPPGTAVVTVGAAELFGAEIGVGE